MAWQVGKDGTGPCGDSVAVGFVVGLLCGQPMTLVPLFSASGNVALSLTFPHGTSVSATGASVSCRQPEKVSSLKPIPPTNFNAHPIGLKAARATARRCRALAGGSGLANVWRRPSCRQTPPDASSTNKSCQRPAPQVAERSLMRRAQSGKRLQLKPRNPPAKIG